MTSTDSDNASSASLVDLLMFKQDVANELVQLRLDLQWRINDLAIDRRQPPPP